MSAAIEAAADEPFFTFMREQIFEPLGMATRGRTPRGTDPGSRDLLLPEVRGGSPLRPAPDAPRDHSCYAGASAFLSTPSDLVRFGLAVSSGTLLQPATVQLLQTPQRLASGEETGYGLGWELETFTLAGEQTRAAGHGSEFARRQSASLMTFPERGIVVAVMSNISYADTASLALKIAQAFAEHGARSRIQ